jgi:hypothetical protein
MRRLPLRGLDSEPCVGHQSASALRPTRSSNSRGRRPESGRERSSKGPVLMGFDSFGLRGLGRRHRREVRSEERNDLGLDATPRRQRRRAIAPSPNGRSRNSVSTFRKVSNGDRPDRRLLPANADTSNFSCNEPSTEEFTYALQRNRLSRLLRYQAHSGPA